MGSDNGENQDEWNWGERDYYTILNIVSSTHAQEINESQLLV
jgi:hypothetical protein